MRGEFLVARVTACNLYVLGLALRRNKRGETHRKLVCMCFRAVKVHPQPHWAAGQRVYIFVHHVGVEESQEGGEYANVFSRAKHPVCGSAFEARE